jgi:hypothetical protein
VLVGAPAPVFVAELILIPGRRRHDGGDLLDRSAGAAIAMRKQSAELFDGINWIEIDGQRIGTTPRARIQPAGPSGQIVSLESFKKIRPDSKVGRDFLD